MDKGDFLVLNCGRAEVILAVPRSTAALAFHACHLNLGISW